MTPTDSGSVSVPGGHLFYQRWQPDECATSAPLLLLHDSLGCVALWRDFPALLASTLRRPVIAYDRLGFGQSSARQGLPSFDFIREEAEQYFPALRDALGLERVALFGHSVGGAMAILIAATHPNGCEAVITESAQAFVEDRTRAGILAAKPQFEQPEQLAKLERLHGDKARWVLRAWTDLWLDPAFADWSLDPDLPRVRCPLLAIHGDQDEYGSLAFPRRIVSGVSGPAQMLILPGCGHIPHREQRDEVTRGVVGFLSGC